MKILVVYICMLAFGFCLNKTDAVGRGRKRKFKQIRTDPGSMHQPLFPILLAPGYSVLNMTESGVYNEDLHGTNFTHSFEAEIHQALKFLSFKDKYHEDFGATDFNTTLQKTPFGVFNIGERIANSAESAIFILDDRLPNFLIKFQTNCQSLTEWQSFGIEGSTTLPGAHPLMIDYLFLRHAWSTGLVPAVNFLSPPSVPCPTTSGKCDFEMHSDLLDSCRNNFGSLRYMIMERVRGQDLHQFKRRFSDGMVPFTIAMMVGIAVIEGLEILHNQAQIIHGDIHSGNIILQQLMFLNETAKIKFVDFGRASLIGERKSLRNRNADYWTSELFSQWEIYGYPSAARDDVDRAVSTIGRLINSWAYYDHEDMVRYCGNGAMKQHKVSTKVFWMDGIDNSIDMLRIPSQSKILIKEQLTEIVALVRRMDHVNTTPPYRQLLDLFRRCLDIAKGLTITTDSFWNPL